MGSEQGAEYNRLRSESGWSESRISESENL